MSRWNCKVCGGRVMQDVATKTFDCGCTKSTLEAVNAVGVPRNWGRGGVYRFENINIGSDDFMIEALAPKEAVAATPHKSDNPAKGHGGLATRGWVVGYKIGEWLIDRDDWQIKGPVVSIAGDEITVHMVSQRTPEHNRFLILSGQDGKRKEYAVASVGEWRRMTDDEQHVNQFEFHKWKSKRGWWG